MSEFNPNDAILGLSAVLRSLSKSSSEKRVEGDPAFQVRITAEDIGCAVADGLDRMAFSTDNRQAIREAARETEKALECARRERDIAAAVRDLALGVTKVALDLLTKDPAERDEEVVEAILDEYEALSRHKGPKH